MNNIKNLETEKKEARVAIPSKSIKINKIKVKHDSQSAEVQSFNHARCN